MNRADDPRDKSLRLAQQHLVNEGTERDTRPTVPLAPGGLSNLVLFGLACALGLTVFTMLGQGAPPSAPAVAPRARTDLETVPPLEVPMAAPLPPTEPVTQSPVSPPSVPLPVSQPYPEPAYLPAPPVPVSRLRDGPLSDPAVVVNATAPQTEEGAATSGSAGEIRAGRLHNPETSVVQGTLIKAVLETPIDSTRPGLARAMVSRDVLSFDGRSVLIPRGSRVIGEFQADATPGQKRALILWTQLIRSDGVTMALTSPTADVLGRGGVRGRVNSHFFERFGGAIFQSILTVGVNSATQSDSNSVVVALPGAVGQMGQGVAGATDVRPTISIRQGESITIFVAHPLDFSGSEVQP